MKKSLIILLFLFLLTGCSVKYNIEFIDDEIFENFTVSVDKEKEVDAINYFKNNEFYAQIVPDMIKYDKKIKETENTMNFNYSHKYDIDSYKKSMTLSNCFQGYNIIKEDNYYLISTTQGVKCMTSDYSTLINELDIVITSNHKLIETNADEISKYSYIWHVDKDNYKNKSIRLKLYQNKNVFDYKGNLKKTLLAIAIFSILVIVLFIYIIIKRKRAKKF